MNIHSEPISMRGNSLPSLPLDCWRHVLDVLLFDNFLSISRASRDLNVYVKPLIYRTVFLKWEPVPWVRVLQLLRTILRQPECASYVHVSFLPESSSNWKPNKDKSDLKDVLRQAEAFVKEAELPNTSMWVKALHDEDPFACVAIFLSQLHNLQTLRLDWSFVRRSGFSGLMFYHALSSTPSGMLSAFGSLTIVDYGSNLPTVLENNDEAYPSARMRCNEYQSTAWFYLPSLRSLAIWLLTRQDVLVRNWKRTWDNCTLLQLLD